jgi:response regulator RpfG family c-di-GMP phosphodiesterase
MKLSQLGYTCFEAANAEQAKAQLATKPIELVLMDIKMPGQTGVQLLPEIIAAYPDLAVIMMTAVNETQVAIDCLKKGAQDYLTKPFNLDEITLSTQRALERRRLVLENRGYQRGLEDKVQAMTTKIRASFFNTIESLAYALEAKDFYTRGHSERVAGMAVGVARDMGLAEEEQEHVRLGGLIHDIGKIGVRELVLNKADKLAPEEYEQVKQHCYIGERILRPVIDSEDILKMVRHHHERYDGGGYPDGLRGGDIPHGAAILAVCDAYDAMTSQRSYRPAMSIEAARAEVVRGKGSQFAPEVTDAFLRVYPTVTGLASVRK